MPLPCSVCEHPQRQAIDAQLAHETLSIRRIASQYSLIDTSLRRHKANHLPKRLAKAAERAENKDADEFLDHIRLMMAAGVKGVEMGQDAASRLADDPATLYRMTPAFMAQSLRAAELLGQATGRLGSTAAPGGINVNLQIVMPRSADATSARAIEVTAVPVLEPAAEPGEPE